MSGNRTESNRDCGTDRLKGWTTYINELPNIFGDRRVCGRECSDPSNKDRINTTAVLSVMTNDIWTQYTAAVLDHHGRVLCAVVCRSLSRCSDSSAVTSCLLFSILFFERGGVVRFDFVGGCAVQLDTFRELLRVDDAAKSSCSFVTRTHPQTKSRYATKPNRHVKMILPLYLSLS